MKKYILKLTACAALSLSMFSSCDTDAEGILYESGKTEYAFASTLQKVELLPSDGNKISVPVYRNTTVGASTVTISIEAVSENVKDLFSLVTPNVTFEDGKSMAEAVVSYQDIKPVGSGRCLPVFFKTSTKPKLLLRNKIPYKCLHNADLLSTRLEPAYSVPNFSVMKTAPPILWISSWKKRKRQTYIACWMCTKSVIRSFSPLTTMEMSLHSEIRKQDMCIQPTA